MLHEMSVPRYGSTVNNEIRYFEFRGVSEGEICVLYWEFLDSLVEGPNDHNESIYNLLEEKGLRALRFTRCLDMDRNLHESDLPYSACAMSERLQNVRGARILKPVGLQTAEYRAQLQDQYYRLDQHITEFAGYCLEQGISMAERLPQGFGTALDDDLERLEAIDMERQSDYQ